MVIRMGEGKFNLNNARVFLGRYANIHLKDGSVIVNVFVEKAQKNKQQNIPVLHCLIPKEKRQIKIPVKEIAWAEALNSNLLS
jgi:hypothetical protein